MNYSKVKKLIMQFGDNISDENKDLITYDILTGMISKKTMNIIAKLLYIQSKSIMSYDYEFNIKKITKNDNELLQLAQSFVDLGHLNLAVVCLICNKQPDLYQHTLSNKIYKFKTCTIYTRNSFQKYIETITNDTLNIEKRDIKDAVLNYVKHPLDVYNSKYDYMICDNGKFHLVDSNSLENIINSQM